MGKTSVQSKLNISGRIAWLTMESPGFLTLLYLMRTMPALHGIDDLPWQNTVLAGLFVIHYAYRAVLFPLIQPSMSPVHVLVWALAVIFQLLNATCLGSWLAAYGPAATAAASASADNDAATATGVVTTTIALPQFALGILIFYLGLGSNFFHDEELREIRRRELRRQAGSDDAAKGVAKHYQIPQAGLFRYMLFPHYFCEWVEWSGFCIAAGWSCAPARAFLINEIFAMLPRAVKGKAWYLNKFGEDKIRKKWAVIPGVW